MERSRSKLGPFQEMIIRQRELSRTVDNIHNDDCSVPTWLYIGDVAMPAFTNGYSNFSNENDGRSNARFWRSSDGIVYLQGVIKGGNAPPISPFSPLPSGFRPGTVKAFGDRGIHRFVTPTSTGLAIVSVDWAGAVTIVSGSAVWVELTGISFRSER